MVIYMLNFIGVGSAFNTKYGNTSSYIKNNSSLLLIDCGSTVFQRLLERDLLCNLENLCIIITHTHPDHVGSLGEIILYSHYVLKIKPVIVFPDKKLIDQYLMSMGVSSDRYLINDNMEVNLDNFIMKKCRVKFLKVSHVSLIPSYGFIMKYEEDKFYYSGDSNNISEEILAMFKNNFIDYIYQDTCGLDYKENNHLSLGKLKKMIPEHIRNRVFCMHYDSHITRNEIESLGFNYIEVL